MGRQAPVRLILLSVIARNYRHADCDHHRHHRLGRPHRTGPTGHQERHRWPPGAHGAPGRAAGRIARSDHQPGQIQLTVSCGIKVITPAWNRPPDSLDKTGQAEWTRVVGLLVERGHWDPLRSTVLLAYCASYADWHRLTEQVRGREVVLQGGTRTVDAQGHVTTEGGKAAPNPLLPVIDRAHRSLQVALEELLRPAPWALTPAPGPRSRRHAARARASLAAPSRRDRESLRRLSLLPGSRRTTVAGKSGAKVGCDPHAHRAVVTQACLGHPRPAVGRASGPHHGRGQHRRDPDHAA